MRKLYLLFSLIVGFESYGQTLYVPSGTGGIGSSANSNVGIGTSSPSQRLHIFNASGSTFLNIEKPNGSSEGGLQFSKAGTVQFYFWNDDSTDGLKISSTGVAGENDGTPRMEFPFANKNVLIASSGGNVGIGTATPSSRLTIKGAQTAEETILNITNSADHDFQVKLSTPGATIKRTIIGPSTANRFSLGVGVGSGNEHLTIINGGNVGIGTTSPNQKLTVNGTIYGKEVKVDLSVPGPDYVFEKAYALPSLESIQTYIDQNKHLPEVPSAKEMEVNGINLSEMNMLLLKKVEELMLYAIDANKKIDAQQKQIDELRKKIN